MPLTYNIQTVPVPPLKSRNQNGFNWMFRCLLSSLLLFIGSFNAEAQPPRPSQAQDTVRIVEILQADQFLFRTIDSVTQLQILKGHVRIRQGETYFSADSIIYNEQNNFMEAFGNVQIRDADSIKIYSSYMQYEGTRKLATFRKQVKLTDGNSTLFTDEMDYDMNAKIGTYRNGGRIESKQTTLTSNEGFYYADIKDVYFIGNVKMSDPDVALASDSLLYNTGNQVATFIAPTTIKSKSSVVNTREGYYDLKFKKAKFGSRARMQDSTTVLIADDFAFDEKTGLGEAKGNIQYKDTAQGVLLFSNRAYFNKIKKNVLATEKPVLVVIQESDSIYIAADTIYSGTIRDLPTLRKGYIHSFDTTVSAIPPVTDTLRTQQKGASTDSVVKKQNIVNADSVRFITAFRHVRIYSDSLQAICDSLFFSGIDSTFELYYNPIAWSKGSQISGDTILIKTQNKRPSELNVRENAFLIQEVQQQRGFYNQISGRTLQGLFESGNLRYVKVKGIAASIYYAQDNDSAFVGMNRSYADIIELYFLNQAIQKVKYTRSVKGVTYPIRKLPEDMLQLKGFFWMDAKRPKNKIELFL
jgi:lipopolysaccharide export system protein LptA